MKNFILFLGLISIFSCEKEFAQIKDVVNEKKINTVILTIDSITKYKSDYDWFSVASNREYNMSTEFFFADSLGKMENLTSTIKENHTVKYEVDDVLGFKINILDKTSNGQPLGLLTNFKTSKANMGNLKITIFNTQSCTNVFEYTFPTIVATP